MKKLQRDCRRKQDKVMKFRDLGAQYECLKDEIDSAIADVLDAGVFIGGEPVKTLERELAEYVGVKHCITCGNGTDALQLALMAWGIGEGDAVFVPDFTFFSSGEVVSAMGATPVFVDVDESTFNLDSTKLEEAVSSVEKEGRLQPRVVIAVDLFGLPADYPAIRNVCAKHELSLLEDGAQGFGGSIKGEMACSFGDISTTSFFPAKPLGCYGDGGAIFTNDDDWAELVRSYAVHGKGAMKYDNIRIGMNSRLDTIQAAILRIKLKAFKDYELESVNWIAGYYSDLFLEANMSTKDFALPFVPEHTKSAWAQYTVKLPIGIERGNLQDHLSSCGIPTMVYYPKPMHEQLAFSGPNQCVNYSTNTKFLCDSVLSLPIGPYFRERDCQIVVSALLSSPMLLG